MAISSVEIQQNLLAAYRARPEVLACEANESLLADALNENLIEPTVANIITAMDALKDVLAKRVQALPESKYVERESEPAEPVQVDPEVARQQAFETHQAKLRQLGKEMQSADPAVREAAKKALREIAKTEPKGIYKAGLAF